jgi:hypothetical protein
MTQRPTSCLLHFADEAELLARMCCPQSALAWIPDEGLSLVCTVGIEPGKVLEPATRTDWDS